MNLTGPLDFRPKLFSALSQYSFDKFKADLIAGIVVGIVALPLAIAFGIASGVNPTVGLITAIIGGFIVSAAGGCSVQIGGPTGAFIVIVYNIIANFGLEGLAVATFMAGLILVALGMFRLGTVIKFIPYPIVVGFTAGIALTIFSTQINDFFGLGLRNVPSEFIPKWGMYISSFGSVDPATLIVGVVSLLIIVITPKLSRRLPGALLAIIIVTAVVFLIPGIHVETIGDRFGELATDIPQPHGFELNMATINRLLPSAFTIAILGAIESLLSATVADGVTGSRTDSNTELIGQGMANIVVPFFGGIPVTGAIARTMTNITNGGRTPVAGIVHAVVLFLIFLFLMPLINLVPMSCLAAVLIVVAYNMSGWRTIRALFHSPKSDISVLAVTFLLTVIFDLTIAIEMGLLLAIILFLRRVMDNIEIKVYSQKLDIAEGSESTVHEVLNVNPGVEIYEIDGPFFFGVATKFDEMMRSTLGRKPSVRIIRMRKVPFIDSTGIHNLLVNAGIDRLLGEDHICDHITKAVVMANRLAPAEDAQASLA